MSYYVACVFFDLWWEGRHYVGSISESVQLNTECLSTDAKSSYFLPLCIV